MALLVILAGCFEGLRVEHGWQHAAIGTDRYMIFPSNFRDVIDVIQQHGPARMHVAREIRHEIDADDSALVGDRANRRVRDITRMVRNRTSAGMADRQWTLCIMDGFLDGPGTTMGEIEQELFGLDSADGIAS